MARPDPVTVAAATTISYSRSRNVRRRSRTLHGPESIGLCREGIRVRGRQLRDGARRASLADALSRNPDILEFTFCATTRRDHVLDTFDDVFETRIRYMKGLVVLAPAGNDGKRRRTWPAAYREVISVGALSANWRDRAWFSNYGKWVDVYAPGEDLINAFPSGTYVLPSLLTGRTGNSMGWPSGAGRRSQRPSSPG